MTSPENLDDDPVPPPSEASLEQRPSPYLEKRPVDLEKTGDYSENRAADVPPPSAESFDTAVPVVRPEEPRPIIRPARKSRDLPASEEAEQHVIDCCLLDGDETIRRCLDSGLTHESFYWPVHQTLFRVITDLHQRGKPVGLEVLSEELTARKLLAQIGGYGNLMQITGKVPTTAMVGYFIEKVRELAVRRQIIRQATRTIEEAHDSTDSVDDFLAEAKRRLEELGSPARSAFPQRPPSAFTIPPHADRSILLGNRFLNRGDGLILSGPSGLGKSSISLQSAVLWAMGKPFQGIQPNGCLKSLIIQSEDSDGDIAEVWASILHVLQPTLEERALLDANIRIVTDRVNRGNRFLASLRHHTATFKADLVWLNPLQAFIDGDVTDSQDIGRFLREGLNGLNRDAAFGYIIIHHTTKPATGKDRQDRLWHEVMYDMAGGAELINWARAILSLRPTTTEGEFKLVLAKRGRRAGVVREVDAGVGIRHEPVTVIGLKHAQGLIPGTTSPLIFWEPCDLPPEPDRPASLKGRPARYNFEDYRSVFPKKNDPGLPLSQLLKFCQQNGPAEKGTFPGVLKRWAEAGDIEIIRPERGPMRYRAARDF